MITIIKAIIIILFAAMIGWTWGLVIDALTTYIKKNK